MALPTRLTADTHLVQRQPTPLTTIDLPPPDLGSDAETPRTPHGHPLTGRRRVSPLPLLKIMPLCISRVAEGLMYAVIFPYINEMIHGFGVPDHSVGMWSAAAESALMVTEAVSAPLYAPVADRLGRKPVFVPILALWGIFATAFGFASGPWSTVVLRGCLGLLAGAGVLSRTMLGELCDKTNRIQGFALFSPSITIGSTLAQLVGGYCAHPVPGIFPSSFTLFVRYPYLLPALITGITGFAASAVSLYFLPETLPPSMRRVHARTDREKTAQRGGVGTLLGYAKFQKVLILYALNNGIMFSWEAIYPLFAFTDQKLGGLGLTTEMIGVVLAFGAALSIFMTVFLFPRLHAAVPSDDLFLKICLAAYPAAIIFFPFLWAANYGQDGAGLSARSWALLMAQMFVRRLGDFAATMLDTIVLDAIPSSDYLAMANSITFSAAATGRAVGPMVVSYFFSVSTTYPSPLSAGRQIVWVVFILMCLPSIYLAGSLSDVRSKEGDDRDERVELLARDEESSSAF
ncbi:hypothetical protein Q5752_006403 [Cryptotrichosporon argae]